jgi:hypothetical protein
MKLAKWLAGLVVSMVFSVASAQSPAPNNFFQPGVHLYKVKQVQDGNWTVVWPAAYPKPGAKLVTGVR